MNKEAWCKRLLSQSSKRARKAGLEMELTLEYLLRMWNRQKGACALTGIEFFETSEKAHKRRPFVPSLDRVDSNKGYLKNNVRIVCVAVNMALFTWGDEVFDYVARKRMAFLAPPVKKEKYTGPQIICRGHTETYFKLGVGWFRMREKEGLPVPEPLSKKQYGDRYWYKYDTTKVQEWLNDNNI